MMEERNTVFDYIAKVFATYGIMVVIFILFSLLIGNSIGDYSSLFILGDRGLSMATLLQLLLLAGIITIAQSVFLTDRWIKKMPITLRNVLFYFVSMLTIVALILRFEWFPINDLKAWIGFFFSFTISVSISVVITRLRERAENNKMEAALKKYHEHETGV
ncbi:MAG: hypothetical protein GX260_05995 [Tissierellia bacterium]|nr:hypothetical protein [Tissierellia bacterium]